MPTVASAVAHVVTTMAGFTVSGSAMRVNANPLATKARKGRTGGSASARRSESDTSRRLFAGRCLKTMRRRYDRTRARGATAEAAEPDRFERRGAWC
jgi:hypothetical protein